MADYRRHNRPAAPRRASRKHRTARRQSQVARKAAAADRRRRIGAVLGATAVFVVLSTLSLGGYVLAARWEAFRLRRVEAPGLSRARALQLLRRAGLDRTAGLLTLRLDRLHRRLRRDPWVKSVNLSRRLPDTLVMRIEPYRPVAILRFGGLYYLDRQGTPFKRLDPGDALDLPVITLAREALAAGVIPAESGVRRSLELLFGLRAHGAPFAGRNISEIVYDPHLGFTVILGRGPAWIRFGFNRLKMQLRRLHQVLRNLPPPKRAGCLIDLDYPDRAVVRIVSGRGRP
ncbi:MAG: FtsQ-type POTRA domain-containing protein [Proteobacteria bacterium]|nr:FtsQ-type POTRA domain-containing protein [Pseudomonadota bacterium]